MTTNGKIDEVLHYIRERFGIPEGDAELEQELAGIRMELERLEQKYIEIQAAFD